MRSFVALIVCIAAFELPTVAQDESLHGVREFTESGTWRVPPGVTSITIELWEAGEIYTITIGRGGVGGRGEGREPQPGADGGDTTFSRDSQTLFAALGGRGGRPPSNSGTVAGPPGRSRSLDYLATGLPKAGDRVGAERFLDRASPWSLSFVTVIPLAPLVP